MIEEKIDESKMAPLPPDEQPYDDMGGGTSAAGDIIKQSSNALLKLNKVTFLGIFKGLVCGIIGILLFLLAYYGMKKIDRAADTENVKSAIMDVDRIKTQQDSLCYAATPEIETNISHETSYLREALNADIVTVEILHNSVKVAGGSHKRFYDEAYPSINEARGVKFNPKDYQNQATNLVPLISYMQLNKFGIFTVDDIRQIDTGYANGMDLAGSAVIALRFMWTKEGEPLGILTSSWQKRSMNYRPSDEEIKTSMDEVGARIETYLDMSQFNPN